MQRFDQETKCEYVVFNVQHTCSGLIAMSVGCASQTNSTCILSGQVFKGLKNEVQEVAIKVINQTDTHQLAEFAKVICPGSGPAEL